MMEAARVMSDPMANIREAYTPRSSGLISLSLVMMAYPHPLDLVHSIHPLIIPFMVGPGAGISSVNASKGNPGRISSENPARSHHGSLEKLFYMTAEISAAL